MEVHHPSQPAHKKKWSEYLLEFFMLFLAIFLGFVAENFREHVVEKNRAKTLTTALIKDLRKDTAELNRLSAFEILQVGRLDSLDSLLKMPLSQVPQKDFHRLVRWSQVSFSFVPANATINQLKNAGYLRYFSKDSLSVYLSEYDFLIKDNEGEDQIITSLIYDKYYDLLFKILNPDLIGFDAKKIQSVPLSAGLPSIEVQDIKRMRNLIAFIKRARDVYFYDYLALKNKAIQIMEYLTK